MEYIVQKESLTEIADAIREKTGGSDLLKFSEIASEIKNISTGVTADTREIYQGTRPLEWIRMPDYDKLDGKCFYVLFHILPYGDNVLQFHFRYEGTLTVEYGSTKDGVFVPDAEFGKDVIEGIGSTGDAPVYKKVFNYADWGKYPLSNGRRQILIRFHFSGKPYRILMPEGYKYTKVKECLCDCNFDSTFLIYGGTISCYYYYISKAMISTTFPSGIPAKYVMREDGAPFSNGVSSVYSENLIKVFSPFKATSYGELLRGCRSLEEVTIDISEVTSWGNVFRGTCERLRKVTFIGGENLTSFPGDINLNPCDMNVDCVRDFFNTLPDITPSETARTITLTNSPAATAGIPEDVLSIATNKGWTVTT